MLESTAARALAPLLACSALTCASGRGAEAPVAAPDVTVAPASAPVPPPPPPAPPDTPAVAPAAAPPTPLISDAVAEVEYGEIERDITQKFERAHRPYKGSPVDVIRGYQRDAVTAKAFSDRLQAFVDRRPSMRWAAAAAARQGSLYDSLRTWLTTANPPDVVLFTPEQEKAMRRAEASGSPDVREKAEAIRKQIAEAWKAAQDHEASAADEIAIDRYSAAVSGADRYQITHPAIEQARERLRYFTELLGAATVSGYSRGGGPP